MCAIHGCSNVPTRKVDGVEVCEEHWNCIHSSKRGTIRMKDLIETLEYIVKNPREAEDVARVMLERIKKQKQEAIVRLTHKVIFG